MTTEAQRQARLESLAIVRAMLKGDSAITETLMPLCEDPRQLAFEACALSASLLTIMAPDQRTRVLDGLTVAAVSE